MCWSSDVKNEEAEAGFDDHSRELLENISIEQKFEVTYVDIEELSKKVIFLKKNIVIFENRSEIDCIRNFFICMRFVILQRYPVRQRIDEISIFYSLKMISLLRRIFKLE